MKPLQQLFAFVKARGFDPRMLYWLTCQPDLERAWARMPRHEWMLAIAEALGADRNALVAAMDDMALVDSVSAETSEYTVGELRCQAIRKHIGHRDIEALLLGLGKRQQGRALELAAKRWLQ